jgi:hypothetical protein
MIAWAVTSVWARALGAVQLLGSGGHLPVHIRARGWASAMKDEEEGQSGGSRVMEQKKEWLPRRLCTVAEMVDGNRALPTV